MAQRRLWDLLLRALVLKLIEKLDFWYSRSEERAVLQWCTYGTNQSNFILVYTLKLSRF